VLRQGEKAKNVKQAAYACLANETVFKVNVDAVLIDFGCCISDAGGRQRKPGCNLAGPPSGENRAT